MDCTLFNQLMKSPVIGIAYILLLVQTSCGSNPYYDDPVGVPHKGQAYSVQNGASHYFKVWTGRDNKVSYVSVSKPSENTEIRILETKASLTQAKIVGRGRFIVYGSDDGEENMLVLQHINSGGRKRILQLDKNVERIDVANPDDVVTLVYLDASTQIVKLSESMFNFQADIIAPDLPHNQPASSTHCSSITLSGNPVTFIGQNCF